MVSSLLLTTSARLFDAWLSDALFSADESSDSEDDEDSSDSDDGFSSSDDDGLWCADDDSPDLLSRMDVGFADVTLLLLKTRALLSRALLVIAFLRRAG